MRVLGTLLVVGAVLAVLRLALVVFALGLVLLLTWGFLTRPARTLALLAVVALLGAADAHPLAFIAASGAVAVAIMFAGAGIHRPGSSR